MDNERSHFFVCNKIRLILKKNVFEKRTGHLFENFLKIYEHELVIFLLQIKNGYPPSPTAIHDSRNSKIDFLLSVDVI